MWLKRLVTTGIIISGFVLTGLSAEANFEWTFGQSNKQQSRIGLFNNVYHANGQLAWNRNSLLGGSIYHSNGQLAWNSSRLSRNSVYYSNGQLAWNNSLLSGSCYYPDGRLQSFNCNGITVYLGSSIYLTVTKGDAYLNVNGVIYPIPDSNRLSPNSTTRPGRFFFE